jgi:hypothetical protein
VEYILEDRKFTWSYSELRDTYYTFINMSDEEFLADLPAALHFACFVCFIKEIPGYVCLADTGIVHELIHILQLGPQGSTTFSLEETRKLFKDQLKLA